MLYGDNLYDFSLEPLLAFHRAHNALATIATFETPNPTACGLVVTDPAGRVTRFQEKPRLDEVFTHTANAGVYILEPEVLDHIPAGAACDFGRDIFPTLLERAPGRIFALPLGGYLRDTGTPENYRQASWDLLERGEPGVHPTAQLAESVALTGRNVIGAGCTVARGAELSESILWEGCQIGAGAKLNGAILGRGVVVGAGVLVPPGAVIGEGERLL